MSRNSKGLRDMRGGLLPFNGKAFVRDNSCAICEQQLVKVGRCHMCHHCGAVYVVQDNGLLNYLGKRDGC
jgi:hypothetical protein